MDPTSSPFTDGFTDATFADDVTLTSVNDTLTTRAAPPVRPVHPCHEIFISDPRIPNADKLSSNRYYAELPLAFIGIIMIFLVNGKRMFKSSPYFYMCVLTVADTAYLIMDCATKKLFFTPTYLGDAGCSVIEFFFHVTQMFAIGTLVVMTAERMLVVAFPFKFQNFFTVKKATLVLGLLLVSVVLMNAPYTWSGMSRDYISVWLKVKVYACSYKAEFIEHVTASIIIKIYLFVVAPMVILFVCNLVIIATMVRMVRTKAKLSEGGAEKSKGQLRHVTTQTLSVSVAFIILCFPYTLGFVPGSPLRNLKITDCEGQLNVQVFLEVAKFLYSLQHCINGFVYCLCSAKFRKELLLALHITQPKKSAGSSSGTRMTSMPSVSASSTQ